MPIEMIDYNTTILAVAVAFTVVLAIMSLIQLYMMFHGINPLEQHDKVKYTFVLILVVLVILLAAHIISSMGNNGVGKDNMDILLPGIFAIVFTVAASFLAMRVKKVGESDLVFFAMCLVITWICIIVHIASRALL